MVQHPFSQEGDSFLHSNSRTLEL